MDLYQLRYFLAVAETGNFTKAAARSFISQPSLSQQILNLEEELGKQLFHRLGRKAVLTESGKTLLEGARRILGDVDQTLHELKESTQFGPKVTVGAIPTVAPFLFPAVIAYCRASEILLDIHTQEDFRRPLAESVRDENFILLGEASTLTLQIQRFCGDADFEPHISHRCGQLATAKSLTA